jgi:uncharacterized membrane protein YGL010W
MSHTADAAPPSRALDRLLARYADDHRNGVNQALHTLCVPVIFWCALALFWSANPVIAVAAAAAAGLFYLRLSLGWGLAMIVVMALGLALASITPHRLWVAAILFALAWIGQFVGHAVEGRRPSFLDDLRFLLVGPLWVLAKVVRPGSAGDAGVGRVPAGDD